jgi:D-3-phosphoglycerate dehydrogenase
MAGAILVTGSNFPAEVLTMIEKRSFPVRAVRADDLTDAGLHDALDGVRGYLIGGREEPVAEHFERATTLEAVAFVGTDYRGYVPGWRRAFELGIAFVSTPGANAVTVAEFTVRLMLTLARPLPAGPASRELSGQTLGVLGAGRIGARVARIAALGLGMRVLYAAPRRNESLESALGLRHVSLADLLEESDVVTLHRPGPDAAEPPTLGREELGRMKTGALLINTGHPLLVDPGALASAIEDGRIRAAFDGTGRGPEWDRLAALGAERFLGTPQSAFITREALLRAASWAAGAVCDVLDGMDSPWVDNPGYRRARPRRVV